MRDTDGTTCCWQRKWITWWTASRLVMGKYDRRKMWRMRALLFDCSGNTSQSRWRSKYRKWLKPPRWWPSQKRIFLRFCFVQYRLMRVVVVAKPLSSHTTMNSEPMVSLILFHKITIRNRRQINRDTFRSLSPVWRMLCSRWWKTIRTFFFEMVGLYFWITHRGGEGGGGGCRWSE